MSFSIHLNEDSISTGTVSVGWTVPSEVFDKFESYAIKNPQVFFIISPVDKYSVFKEQREMVPLRDLIAYLELPSYGEHYIYAAIVDKDNRWTGKAHGKYAETVLNDDGDELFDYFLNRGSDSFYLSSARKPSPQRLCRRRGMNCEQRPVDFGCATRRVAL